MSVKQAPPWLPNHSSRFLSVGAALAMLYFGRHVLIPLALAIMLSLLMAPAVRALRPIGVGRTFSVFKAGKANSTPIVLHMRIAPIQWAHRFLIPKLYSTPD